MIIPLVFYLAWPTSTWHTYCGYIYNLISEVIQLLLRLFFLTHALSFGFKVGRGAGMSYGSSSTRKDSEEGIGLHISVSAKACHLCLCDLFITAALPHCHASF